MGNPLTGEILARLARTRWRPRNILPARGFFGSRQGLVTGLVLAGVGTLGAALWSLALGSPLSGLDGTVIAGASHDTNAVATTLVQTTATTFQYPGELNLAWPSSGTAAIEVEGMGLLGHQGSMTARSAIASITKTMTAYVILKDHPLTGDSSGPTITLTSAMNAEYDAAIARDESTVVTSTGERITERQALEALLLASAGNMADVLAMWDKGSVNAFLAEMNQEAHTLGLTGTVYTDPAGLASSTVSTMSDLLKLAEAIQKVPALTAIVAEESANIPVAGTVYNVNRDLGAYGIDGIKTGTTAAAGSCLLFSAHITVGGQRLTILGVVLGMPGSSGIPRTALNAAERLLASAQAQIGEATVASAGHAVAALEQNGRKVAELGVSDKLSVVGWPGLVYRVTVGGTASAATLGVTRTGASSTSATIPLVKLAAHPSASARATTTG